VLYRWAAGARKPPPPRTINRTATTIMTWIHCPYPWQKLNMRNPTLHGYKNSIAQDFVAVTFHCLFGSNIEYGHIIMGVVSQKMFLKSLGNINVGESHRFMSFWKITGYHVWWRFGSRIWNIWPKFLLAWYYWTGICSHVWGSTRHGYLAVR
jgi:hypothetical protein